jgi:hypothetical protein
MRWYNAQKDKLPEDGQQVLISVNGVYYICKYQEEKRQFKIEDELRETAFKVDDYMIYWTEFVDPDL